MTNRKIDYLIAEKVMGFKEVIAYSVGSGGSSGTAVGVATGVKAGFANGVGVGSGAVGEEKDLPFYSTDKDDASLVKDKILSMDNKIRDKFFSNLNGFVAKAVALSPDNPELWEGIDPMDVCIAALRAVGWRG